MQRLRGEVDEAEVSYRRGARPGTRRNRDLPYCAWRRAGCGTRDRSSTRSPTASIRRPVASCCPSRRDRLAAGDVAEARLAADELTAATPAGGMPLMQAVTMRAEGSVRLEEGDARGALAQLRKAWAISGPTALRGGTVPRARRGAWLTLGDEFWPSWTWRRRGGVRRLGVVRPAPVDGLSRGEQATERRR